MSDEVYAQLLALRKGLRHFEHWSEQQALAAGLTPAHHQLLLAIRGHNEPRGPTVGEVADDLFLRHHSTVGLIDRADEAGLVTRTRDDDDHRVVRLHLTKTGAERLEALSALHLEEIERLGPSLAATSEGLGPVQRAQGRPGLDASRFGQSGPVKVRFAGVYDEVDGKAHRVLVDRSWPRGLDRSVFPFEAWAKDVAPSAALRRWYSGRPERFDEFARRYRDELRDGPPRRALEDLYHQAIETDTVLLTATKNVELSGAAVLKDVLSLPG